MSEPVPGAPAPTGGDPPKPAPVEPPKPVDITMSNEALNKRLADERDAHEKKVRASILKDLGVDKFELAKDAVAKAAKLEQESLSELEKRDLRIKELEPHKQAAERVGSRFKALVDGEFGKLPEAAQKAIDEHAGGDAEKRFDMIELMRKSGALEALGKSGEPPKPAPPASGGPPPAPPPSGKLSKFQEWEAMKTRSSVLGDLFYQSNQREIESSRPAPAA